MREIKFRWWDKEEKEFNKPWGFRSDVDISVILQSCFEDHIPTQYTGLKDKNGVEIYEGDYLWSTGSHRGIVVFEEGRFFVSVWNIKKDIHESDEVVGNIFEGVDK